MILLACALALGLAVVGWQMARTGPDAAPPPTDGAEAKAYDFLADTDLSEAERRETARDIARLCAEGLIDGC